ncbi:MAG: M12 family metallo-peptidase [Fimbriimonadales bacterium]|nr:M12 family metallo-peptidase [Fimbriimonadales bacterium]
MHWGKQFGVSLSLLHFAIAAVFAQQSTDSLWQATPAPVFTAGLGYDLVSELRAYRSFRLDETRMHRILWQAPHEDTVLARHSHVVISLPMPDGSFQRFAVVESPILSPELAKRYPDIKTFVAQGVDNPVATARLDFTPNGFHAMIITPESTAFIDPYGPEAPEVYICYDRRDSKRQRPPCSVQEHKDSDDEGDGLTFDPQSGQIRRTYRLAMNATGEYTQYFGGVSQAEAQIVTTVNRVNGVYENDFCVRFNLVYVRVYPNPNTDPFTSFGNLGSQNQSTLDSVLGSANYDFGHVLTQGNFGGYAGLGVVCRAGQKGVGVSGLDVPRGDAFDIDYVAHEMGHQFNANHTYRLCAGDVAPFPYEPGSGSTIMAYAGVCNPSENVQLYSDPYFHTHSISEVQGFITGSVGNSCAARTTTNNTLPSVSAPSSVRIPQGTPFRLTATGNDPDGDTLTYCWEQYDSNPLFRSRLPALSPTRFFPRLETVMSNSTDPWETLPTASRTMTFRCTVRDNRAGGGGVAIATTQVTVSGVAFRVTQPATGANWNVGSTQSVIWQVGGGNIASTVNILLSLDGGLDYESGSLIVLKANTPNDGVETVTVPNVVGARARIIVEPVGHVFYSPNPGNFRIQDTRRPGDVDSSGCVDDADLLIVLFNFGNGC